MVRTHLWLSISQLPSSPPHSPNLPPTLLWTQGQLSNVFVIDAPSRPQSLCHYRPIAAGNLGHSLGTSDWADVGLTQDYKAHCCPLPPQHTQTQTTNQSADLSDDCEECCQCWRLCPSKQCSIINGLLRKQREPLFFPPLRHTKTWGMKGKEWKLLAHYISWIMWVVTAGTSCKGVSCRVEVTGFQLCQKHFSIQEETFEPQCNLSLLPFIYRLWLMKFSD